MPSKSKKQHNFMEAIAHSSDFSKKAGVPQSVGKDFAAADKGKKFRKGGTTNPSMSGINKQQTHHGKIQLPNVNLNKHIGHRDGGMMKSVDMEKNPGLAKLPTDVRNKMGYMKKGGMSHSDAKEDMKMDKSQDKAMIKKAFAQHDVQAHKGKHTELKLCKGGKMANGGYVRAADGCAQRGKTKGRMV
jgi:hypothetical protein